MKTLKNLLIISLLCLLPATTAYAQLSEVTKQMPQAEAISINNADTEMLAKLPGIGKKKRRQLWIIVKKMANLKALVIYRKLKGLAKNF